MIRLATFKDIIHIHDLIKEHPDTVLPRSISDIIQNIDRFFVYREEEKVVGVISYKILPEMGIEKEHCIEIVSLSVTKSFQGRGIATRLVKHVLSQIKKYKSTKIIALTFSPDFFKKLDFVEISKEKILNKLYLGCINCTKYSSPIDCPEVAMEYKPAT